MGDVGGPFPNLHSDVGCFVSSHPDETAQLSGTSGYLEAKVANAWFDHRRFHNQNGFVWLRKISRASPLVNNELKKFNLIEISPSHSIAYTSWL